MRPNNLAAHKHTRNSQSIDEGLLNLPSPYHDDFSLPPTPTTPRRSFTSYLPSFLQRSTYRSLPTHDSSAADPPSPTIPRCSTRKSHIHRPDSHPSHRANWLLILSLALFLSLLTNAFFLSSRRKNYTTLSHSSFALQERGKNYTCYRTHETTFERVAAYERLNSVHNRYWEDLLGGSAGLIRTKVDRPDGGDVGRARLAMFHQLECLERMREALVSLALGEGNRKGQERRKDFVIIADGDRDGDGAGEVGRCLDYLRQSMLCGADDTVEVEGDDGFGYGRGRTCRDERWLYEVTKCEEGGCEGGPALL